jgi:Collagen triple helix repeat (20 copies)
MLRPHVTYANVVATLALFLALGGGAYAATKLPANSVGPAQIQNGAVSSKKVKNGSLVAADFKKGQLPAGARGVAGDAGPQGAAGAPGTAGAPGSAGTPGAPGAAGADGSALAYARIASATDTIDPAVSKNVTAANLTLKGGVYCFHGLGFTPKNVVATLGGPGIGYADVIRTTAGDLGGVCGAGTQATVTINNATAPGLYTGRTFMVLFN